jgi:hypothetical protein
MSTVIIFFVLATPMILAVMGAFVAVRPPKTKSERALWIVLFIAFAGVGVFAGTVDREQANEETRGGRQFPFVSALPGPGKFPLLITNWTDKSIYDVTVLIFSALDFPTNGRIISVGTLYPVPNDFMRRLDFEVPLGAYAV